MKFIEVEQKYKLEGPADDLRAQLKECGGKPGEPTRQVDTYFNAPHRDFLAARPVVSEWLRLREQAGTASLNYKLWHPIGAARKTHADEYESTVGDPGAIRATLVALGYTELGVVDKTREEWHTGDLAVAIDTVADLGTFVEFEYRGGTGSVEEATAILDAFVATLDVAFGGRVNAGYPHLVLGIKAV